MGITKKAQLRKEVGHTKEAPKCGNCKHFSKTVEVQRVTFWLESKVREKLCSLHNFSTSPGCWCKTHEKGKPKVHYVNL